MGMVRMDSFLPSVCQQRVSSTNTSPASKLSRFFGLLSPSFLHCSSPSFFPSSLCGNSIFMQAFASRCTGTRASSGSLWLSPNWPQSCAAPTALHSGDPSPSGLFQGLSQFVISAAIGCGPGPLLGSRARRLGSGKPAIPAAAENLSPFRLRPSLYRTMSLGKPGSCRVRGEKGLVRPDAQTGT